MRYSCSWTNAIELIRLRLSSNAAWNRSSLSSRACKPSKLEIICMLFLTRWWTSASKISFSWSNPLSSLSVCLRSVISCIIPVRRAGFPWLSKTSSPASAQTVRTDPSGRITRYSIEVGLSSNSTIRLASSTNTRSSGWTERAITSFIAGIKVSLSRPKIWYISSDQTNWLVFIFQDQLPTRARCCAFLRFSSECRSASSACLRLVIS